MPFHQQKILVTGGGSGIGLALTEALLHEGNTLLICGRRADVLQKIKDNHPSVIIRQCDLANETDRIELYDWIAAAHPDLNVLINNAGVQHWMSPDDKDYYTRAKEEIAINIEAPLHLSNIFSALPSLHTIVNVTSGLSFCPLTKVPVYSATKAFMHSYTLSMQHLLKKKNIDVIELIPPALNTDLGGKGLHDWAPPVPAFITSIMEQWKQGKKTLTYELSETMANAGPAEIKTAFDRMNPL